MCNPATLNSIVFGFLEAIDPRNLSCHDLCQKVVEAARVALITLVLILNCVAINPYFCTTAFIIGLIFPNIVYETLTNELFALLHRHPIIASIAITVAILVGPHFAFLAIGSLFNAYYGSKITYEQT